MLSGPQVTIRVGAGPTFTVSKELICKRSTYFAAMFAADAFKEGKENSTILEEIDGVVSSQSVGALLQWLYCGTVTFPSTTPEAALSAVLEFVRLADMVGATGMENAMSDLTKQIILKAVPQPEKDPGSASAQPLDAIHIRSDILMSNITLEHICSASQLSQEHPVRCMVAAAGVEGYLRCDNPKVLMMMEDCPSFALDLLKETKKVLRKLETIRRREGDCSAFTDPITGERLGLPRPRSRS